MNAAEIFRQSIQPSGYEALQSVMGARSESATAAQAAERGSLNGMGFEVVEDPMMELMDSMEELSMQFEEKTVKSMAERKVGGKLTVNLTMIQRVQKWMNSLPDMPTQQAIAQVVKQLRTNLNSRGEPMDAKELMALLKRHSSDPSHVFAMLDCMEGALEEGETLLKDVINRCRTELMKREGAEVKAGLNLADVVKATAENKQEMQQLRDLYRQEVLGFTTPADCFRSLLSSRGQGRLAESLNFIMQGCSVELQSVDPSRSPEELRRIITDLQCVQVLKTVLEKFDGMVANIGKQFGEQSLVNGEQLINQLLDMIDMPFVNSSNFSALMTSTGLMALLAKIYMMTEITKRIRELSPRLFEKDSDRFKLGDAAQEHLDGLISLEQEAEQEKGREAA